MNRCNEIIRFLFLTLLGVALAANASVHVTYRPGTERNDHASTGNTRFIDILDGTTLVKRIECQLDSASCDTFRLSTGGFLLIDCWEHDSVLKTCSLKKYTDQGIEDLSFQPQFAETYSDLRHGKPQIAAVTKVAPPANQKGVVTITGLFQLKELDGLSEFERNFCIGEEECVGFGGRSSEATLTFDAHGKILSKEIHKKATFPYSKQQVTEELKRLINANEAAMKLDQNHGASLFFESQLAKYREQLKAISGP